MIHDRISETDLLPLKRILRHENCHLAVISCGSDRLIEEFLRLEGMEAEFVAAKKVKTENGRIKCIEKCIGSIEDKAENIRLSTKPDGVDEYTADQRDPRVQQWMQQYLPMQTRLYNEELEAELPAKCIQRDAFAQMCAGLTPGEAELVMKHLVV